MRMRHGTVLVIVLASAVLAQAPAAQQLAKAAPAPDGSKQSEAAKKVDRANPKAVVNAFAVALTGGDKATARALAVGPPNAMEYLDAQVDDYTAFNRFDKLLSKKFGDDADFHLRHFDTLPKDVREAKIEVKGLVADVSFYFEAGGQFMGWKLVKVKGQWAVEAASIQTEAGDTPEKLRKHVVATNGLINRLNNGEFSSADQTMEAWEEVHGKIDGE
jgi:hypothetical protein